MHVSQSFHSPQSICCFRAQCSCRGCRLHYRGYLCSTELRRAHADLAGSVSESCHRCVARCRGSCSSACAQSFLCGGGGLCVCAHCDGQQEESCSDTRSGHDCPRYSHDVIGKGCQAALVVWDILHSSRAMHRVRCISGGKEVAASQVWKHLLSGVVPTALDSGVQRVSLCLLCSINSRSPWSLHCYSLLFHRVRRRHGKECTRTTAPTAGPHKCSRTGHAAACSMTTRTSAG